MKRAPKKEISEDEFNFSNIIYIKNPLNTSNRIDKILIVSIGFLLNKKYKGRAKGT